VLPAADEQASLDFGYTSEEETSGGDDDNN
jgi:hypothetical protein